MFEFYLNKFNKLLQLYKIYNNKKLIENFSVYYPNSQNHYIYPKNTFSSVNNSVSILLEITEAKRKIDIITAAQFFPQFRNEQNSELKDLFNKYGSDKSSYHSYDTIYSSVLNILLKDSKSLKVFEIGLGTNNVSVPSNMGINGKPGASLRAFRDYLANSSIFGADIDKEVLFNEERIYTTYIDQTNYLTYLELNQQFNVSSYDLIIDDGLHSPEANLNTLKFSLENLSAKGWLIIEDIPQRSLPIWKIVKSLLVKEYATWIVNCNGDYLFVLNKKNDF